MISVRVLAGSIFVIAASSPFATAQTGGSGAPRRAAQDTQHVRVVSYAADVLPFVTRTCFPCHQAEEDNAGGLTLDTYALMMKGGEHGTPVVAGKPDESIFFMKLAAKPPFGKQMPRKRPPLTAEELNLISTWIAQGAKP